MNPKVNVYGLALFWIFSNIAVSLSSLPMSFPLHLDTHIHINVHDESVKTTDGLEKCVLKCAAGVEEDTELQLSDYHNACV